MPGPRYASGSVTGPLWLDYGVFETAPTETDDTGEMNFQKNFNAGGHITKFVQSRVIGERQPPVVRKDRNGSSDTGSKTIQAYDGSSGCAESGDSRTRRTKRFYETKDISNVYEGL